MAIRNVGNYQYKFPKFKKLRLSPETLDEKNNYRSEKMKFLNQAEYITKCNTKFEMLKNGVLELLPDARVEHVGASSIEGAISKGDLDIFVGIDERVFNNAILKLMTLGFHEKKDCYSF